MKGGNGASTPTHRAADGNPRPPPATPGSARPRRSAGTGCPRARAGVTNVFGPGQMHVNGVEPGSASNRGSSAPRRAPEQEVPVEVGIALVDPLQARLVEPGMDCIRLRVEVVPATLEGFARHHRLSC